MPDGAHNLSKYGIVFKCRNGCGLLNHKIHIPFEFRPVQH